MNNNRPYNNKLTPPPESVIKADGQMVETVGDRWQLSQINLKYTLNFSRFRNVCTPAFVNGLQWACYRRLSKASNGLNYNSLNILINYLEDLFLMKGTQINCISVSDLLNLRSDKTEVFSRLRAFFRVWVENGYYGLASGADDVLSKKTKSRNRKQKHKMKVVDTLCPERGPLLELEEELYNKALKDLYANNIITLEDFLLSKLTLVFGARPVQWSRMKVENLVVVQLAEGRNYGLLIPWAKQKKNRKPVLFPLTRHLGELLFAHAESLRVRFPLSSLSDGMTWEKLPLFPQPTKDVPCPSGADVLAQRIRKIGVKAKIPNQRDGGDGSPISICAMRLRHTVGTRLAARGRYGARDIADFLLQSNILSPMSYVELSEFLLENFNEYWSVRIEVNAKVALGLLGAEEAKKIDAPHITFSEDGRRRQKIGKCGKTNCTARVPLACYSCAKFRPLLDAPHGEYLKILLALRDRHLEIAPKHIGVYDNAIWYVRRVIEACEQVRNGDI